MTDNTAFDLVILVLRIALIFLLYFFIFLVVRTITREFNVSTRPRRVAGPAAPGYEPEDYRQPVAGPGEVTGRLVVTEAGNATTVGPGVVFQLGPITPLGRRANNAIILDDDFVSSEHALLAWRDGRWWLSDVASTNGTTLNGQTISRPTPVNWGDLVGVGRVRMRLEP